MTALQSGTGSAHQPLVDCETMFATKALSHRDPCPWVVLVIADPSPGSRRASDGALENSSWLESAREALRLGSRNRSGKST